MQRGYQSELKHQVNASQHFLAKLPFSPPETCEQTSSRVLVSFCLLHRHSSLSDSAQDTHTHSKSLFLLKYPTVVHVLPQDTAAM